MKTALLASFFSIALVHGNTEPKADEKAAPTDPFPYYGSARPIELAQQPFDFLNKGWFQVNFGQEGSLANGPIVFNSSHHTMIRITDAYAPGDSFLVFDNGRLLFSTPDVRCDSKIMVYDPKVAFGCPDFSWGQHKLPPGKHYIEMMIKESPYRSGSAFYRVDTLLPTCKQGRYIIVQNLQKSADVHATCAYYGLLPVHVTPNQYRDVAGALISCLGHNSQALVAPVMPQHVPNGQVCLTAQVGSNVDSLVVNPPFSCSYDNLPSLCFQPRLLSNDESSEEGH